MSDLRPACRRRISASSSQVPVGLLGLASQTSLRLFGHRRQHGIDIDLVVAVLGDLHLGTCRRCGDRVHQEAVFGLQRRIALAKIGLGQHVQDLVRTGADDDAFGLKAMRFGKRLSQPGRGAFGIVGQVAGRGDQRLDGHGAGAEWGFVGAEFDRLLAGRGARLAGDIGCDFENAGLRLGTLGHGALKAGMAPATLGLQTWRTIRKAPGKRKENWRLRPTACAAAGSWRWPAPCRAPGPAVRPACGGRWPGTVPCGRRSASRRQGCCRETVRPTRKAGPI